MVVICAVGRRGGIELVRRAASLMGQPAELLLLHVIDTGPRHELEHLEGPLRHGPRGGPARERELNEAEESGGQGALDEALAAAQAAGLRVTARLERGKPDQVIVRVGDEVGAALIVIAARDNPTQHPPRGPASVGHTARFVLDHARCDVLLVRL
jgi:nucleotide-binding universal stress UspA family protein